MLSSTLARPRPWCRATGCSERNNLDPVLVDSADGSGLHIGCVDPDAARDAAPCMDPWCGGACGHDVNAHIKTHGPGILISARRNVPSTVVEPSQPPYRVLVTGSRTWDDQSAIAAVLDRLHQQYGAALVVVHGACASGADAIADAWCTTRGVTVERHPAQWSNGKGAGFLRNAQMVATGPTEVHAFIRDGSPGASHCATAAELAGIIVHRHDYPTPAEQSRLGPIAAAPPAPFAAPPGPHPFKRELIDIIRWADSQDPRSLQRTVGPSGIGVACLRRIAYQITEAPAANTIADPWFAIVGKAVHDWLAFALNDYQRRVLGRGPNNPRWLIEQRVRIEADEHGLAGSTDAIDLDHARVCDWKIVGNDNLRHYANHGPSDQYRVQAHTYGLGWERAGYQVREVLIAFLPRSNYLDRAHIWTEPYDRQVALDALTRLNSVRQLAAALPPALIPAAPDPDACLWCDHYRPGGPVDTTGCPGPTTDPGTPGR